MPARAVGREASALLGYACVALVFAWPLPVRMADAMLGLPGGDAGVYVWNLWVFRHEIVQHHRLPFLTSEILALSDPVPLVLHNYTTFANLLAFPLIPLIGVLRTFNVLVMASGVMTGYAMYWYARLRTGDPVAAWIGGLMFGFSPFMSARGAEHFSLTLAAPIPVFAWLLYRMYGDPSRRLACAAGATVAWAFLCDTYFAVYCLMMAAFAATYSIFSVERQSPAVRRVWPRAVVTLAILCVAGLIVGMIVRGGGHMDVLGIRVSFTRLYTPVLVLTGLLGIRVWLSLRPRLVKVVNVTPYAQAAVLAGLVCIAMLSPVLFATGSPFSQRGLMNPEVWWRSSPPGVDLLAFFAPNPLNPIVGRLSYDWFASMPAGFNENVASIPWVAMLTIVGAMWLGRFRPHKGWLIFTGVFVWLALGPFVSVAEQLTYIPTPWAVLRYLPIVGAARMPTRMTILVMLAVSMLLVFAIQDLRTRTRHPRLLTFGIVALLFFELLPAPRTLHSAELPEPYRIVATDPRPVRVLSLPFGLRDGISSRGNYSSITQFYQTFHEKPLIGGYISRLPGDSISRYRGNSTLRVLMRLSEGTEVDPEMMARGARNADRTMQRLELGYVIIDLRRTSPALREFMLSAFPLTPLWSDQTYELYRTPIAAPLRP
jgi:hypothetical protein